MKRIICLLLFSLATLVWAQSPSPSPSLEPIQDPADVEFGLLRQHMVDAINAHDVDSLLEGVTEDVVVTCPDGRVLQGRELVRNFLEKALKGPDPVLQSVKSNLRLDELIVLYSSSAENTGAPYGIAYGSSKDEYAWADGTSMEVNPRWTAALVRDDQTWKIAEFHYSVSMYDNPILSQVRGRLAMYCVASVIAGLMVGFLFGRRRS